LPLPLEGAAPAAPLLPCPGGRRSCGACRPQSNRRQYSRVSTMSLSPIDPDPPHQPDPERPRRARPSIGDTAGWPWSGACLFPLPLEGAAPAAPLLLCLGGRRSCGAAFALPWRAPLLRRLSASIESPAIFAGVDDVSLANRPRSPAPARSRAAAQSAALRGRHRRMAVERGLPRCLCRWRAPLLRRRFCFALEGVAPAAPVGLNRIAGNIRGCRRCISRQSTRSPAPARSKAAAQSAALHWRHRRMAVERGLPSYAGLSVGHLCEMPWSIPRGV